MPPSSAHFVSYAVAFFIAAYGSVCSFAAARNRHQRCPPPPALRATLSHFTLRLKPRKMRGTYTEIARLQPDCNFSVKLRKMRRSGFHLASVITLQYNRYLIQLRILTKLMRHPFRFLQIVILLFTDRYTSQMRAIP